MYVAIAITEEANHVRGSGRCRAEMKELEMNERADILQIECLCMTFSKLL